MKLFTPDLKGTFLERPNRFLLRAETPAGVVEAHCPNPGRMHELLFPGTPLILEKSRSTERKTGYTVVAAIHNGVVVPMHATRMNDIARRLVLPMYFGDDEPQAEVTYGSSRFDFAVSSEKGTSLIEVKSCTLCEHGTAMFPDAPTVRGVRHLREMAGFVEAGCHKDERIQSGKVIFVIGHPAPTVFVPNLHTDPSFASALREVSNILEVHACAIEVKTDGTVSLADPRVPVDYSSTDLVDRDSGVYLAVIEVKAALTLQTGALGEITYIPGWYVYTGSARRGLSKRTARHRRKRKTNKWHVDYLTAAAAKVTTHLIYTRKDLECRLARDVAGISAGQVPGFGSSDCSCRSHLYFFAAPPMKNREFIEILFRYRHKIGLFAAKNADHIEFDIPL